MLGLFKLRRAVCKSNFISIPPCIYIMPHSNLNVNSNHYVLRKIRIKDVLIYWKIGIIAECLKIAGYILDSEGRCV